MNTNWATTQAIVTIVTAFVTTGATVVLAVLTAKYVRWTASMVEEMRVTREPGVFVDIEFPKNDYAALVVGNVGSTPARNVRMTLDDTVPWDGDERLSELAVFRTGISYLVPGRTLRFWAGRIDWKRLQASGGSVDISLTFETESGKTLRREAVFDLSQYVGVGPESFQGPAAQIAEAISAIRPLAGDSGASRNFVRLFQKNCPACASSISSSAKRCPECRVWINTPEPRK